VAVPFAGSGYRRGIGIRAGAISVALLACATLFATPSHAASAPALWVPGLGQHDVVADGVTVGLRAARPATARVAVTVRSNGRAVSTRPRTIRLRAGETRRMRFPLPARARSMAGGCAATSATATATSPGARRRVTRSVEPQAPACSRFFGPAAVWNVAPAPGAPLDPQSRAITGELRRQVDEGIRAGRPPTINTTSYSSPVYTVAGSEPTVRVALDQPRDLAPALQKAFDSVPLPATAKPAAGLDAQLFVWQPATDTLWEFWKLRKASDGWHARWGGRLDDVSTGPGHFAGDRANWGATGTSLPLAGGLMTTAELRAGNIDHALAIALPRVRAHEYALPAQRTDGESNSTTSVPEGARFRIDPAVDLAALNLPPALLPIARAAQRYGMIVRDRGGAVALYAEDPSPFGSDPYPTLFAGRASDLMRRFPWDKLQLMKMDLRREPGSSSPVPNLCGLLPCP
jgi:hypothetical protein